MAWAADSLPERSASAVAGSSSSRRAVSSTSTAERTDDPQAPATKWAADRTPRPCQARVSSTRRAANALPAPASRSTSTNNSNAATAPAAVQTPGVEPRHHLAQHRGYLCQPTRLPDHPTCSHCIERMFV